MWKRYRFTYLSLCIVIALATCIPVIALYCYRYSNIYSLSLLKLIAFGILEQLSLLLVTVLGIMEALLVNKVTPCEEAKSDNV